jgi:hypothetical protein
MADDDGVQELLPPEQPPTVPLDGRPPGRRWRAPVFVGALAAVAVGAFAVPKCDVWDDTRVAKQQAAAPLAPITYTPELASTFFLDMPAAQSLHLTVTGLPQVTTDAKLLPISNEHRALFGAHGFVAELDQFVMVPGIDANAPASAPAGSTAFFHATGDVFYTAGDALFINGLVKQNLTGAGYQSVQSATKGQPEVLQKTLAGLTTTQVVFAPDGNYLARFLAVCNQCESAKARADVDPLLRWMVQSMDRNYTPAQITDITASYDRRRVIALWQDWSAAWKRSVPAGLGYITANDYPGLPAAPDQCRRYFGNPGPGFHVDSVVRPDSIKPAPDWTIPSGALKGSKPTGRIYALTVDQVDTAGTKTTTDAHTTVENGRAHLFFDCTL